MAKRRSYFPKLSLSQRRLLYREGIFRNEIAGLDFEGVKGLYIAVHECRHVKTNTRGELLYQKSEVPDSGIFLVTVEHDSKLLAISLLHAPMELSAIETHLRDLKGHLSGCGDTVQVGLGRDDPALQAIATALHQLGYAQPMHGYATAHVSRLEWEGLSVAECLLVGALRLFKAADTPLSLANMPWNQWYWFSLPSRFQEADYILTVWELVKWLKGNQSDGLIARMRVCAMNGTFSSSAQKFVNESDREPYGGSWKPFFQSALNAVYCAAECFLDEDPVYPTRALARSAAYWFESNEELKGISITFHQRNSLNALQSFASNVLLLSSDINNKPDDWFFLNYALEEAFAAWLNNPVSKSQNAFAVLLELKAADAQATAHIAQLCDDTLLHVFRRLLAIDGDCKCFFLPPITHRVSARYAAYELYHLLHSPSEQNYRTGARGFQRERVGSDFALLLHMEAKDDEKRSPTPTLDAAFYKKLSTEVAHALAGTGVTLESASPFSRRFSRYWPANLGEAPADVEQSKAKPNEG